MKTRLIAVILTLTIAAGCSGTSNTDVKDNPTFGKFPSIAYSCYIKADEVYNRYDGRLAESNDPEKLKEKRNKEMEEIYRKGIGRLEKEEDKLDGREVPFEQEQVGKYEVVSVDIHGADATDMAIYLKVRVKAVTDLRSDSSARMYYLMVDSGGTIIQKGVISPFHSYVPATLQPLNKNFKAGDILLETGSNITLVCKNTNYSDFAMMRFVSRETYDNAR
ncbi:MAG: hypothetical protein LIO77_01410 [Rikenellaceae bacterium]|nr:hypothetical protein [Rikenellaceae bacterium]